MKKRALLKPSPQNVRYDAIVEEDNLVKPDSDKKTVSEKLSIQFSSFFAIDIDKITEK